MNKNLYNYLGESLRQTVGSVTTNFTTDLEGGLSQVLSDGTHTYLYGNGRIAQFSETETGYFLGDALGSVRQPADEAGAVTLVEAYQPYGDLLESEGEAQSSYGFTGEWNDSNSDLTYLRARWYDSGTGRFVSKDTWEGDYYKPASYVGWLYAYGNPILYVDPEGEYNRYAAVRAAQAADLFDNFSQSEVWNAIGTDCTAFVSYALWTGGLKDYRSNPENDGKQSFIRY
jgi:RHS repeat-associated protein